MARPPPPRLDDRRWEDWQKKTDARVEEERAWEDWRRQTDERDWRSLPSADARTSHDPPPRRPMSPYDPIPRHQISPYEPTTRRPISPYRSRRSRSPRRRLSIDRGSGVKDGRLGESHRIFERSTNDSPEPGQIVGSSNLSRSRSPEKRDGQPPGSLQDRISGRSRMQSASVSSYRPRTSGASTPLHSPKRPRSRSPKTVADSHTAPSVGSVTAALEVFSKSMHSTMISTSSHALATQSLARLHTFAHTDASALALEDALRRVDDAERALHAQLSHLQSDFVEVMRRALAKPGVIEGDVSALKMDGLNERLARLETMGPMRRSELENSRTGAVDTATFPPPPPPPLTASLPPGPAPSDIVRLTPPPTAQDVEMAPVDIEAENAEVDTNPTQERRSRARQLLTDVLSRVEAVEAMKQGFEDRFDEFENHLFLGQGEAIDRIRSWDELERRRDPAGRLSGVIRQSGKETMSTVQEETMAAIQDQLATMKKEMALITAERDTFQIESESVSGMKEEIQALRDRTETLEADRERYKREKIETAKESVDEDDTIMRGDILSPGPDTGAPKANGHFTASGDAQNSYKAISPRLPASPSGIERE